MRREKGDGFVFVDLTDEAGRVVDEMAEHLVEAGALMARDEVVSVMESSSPSGREYLVPGTATRYRASAPGQPPAVREGQYRNSWRSTPAARVGTEIVAYAYTDLRVGQHVLGDLLEYGTSRMRPRPHARPATLSVAPKIARLARSRS